MFNKMMVEGRLLYETHTHYFTKTENGVSSWHKDWYRLPKNLY